MADQPSISVETGKDAPARSGLRIASFREIFGIDLRTLALFRAGLATLLLVDLALRARDLTAHYTDFGVMPRAVQSTNLDPFAWSVHLVNGTAWFQAVLFCAAALFAVMLFAGYRTRLATVMSWALLLSVLGLMMVVVGIMLG